MTSGILAGFAGALASLLLIGAVWATLKAVRGTRRVVASIGRVVHVLEVNAKETAALTAEYRYIRSAAAQVGGQTPPPPTAPPMGQQSTMPPAFPTWGRDYYADATPEDTDRASLEQTDEEMMVAQQREEAAASGIELDDDELPAQAVREDV